MEATTKLSDVLHADHPSRLSAEEIDKALKRHNREHPQVPAQPVARGRGAEKRRK